MVMVPWSFLVVSLVLRRPPSMNGAERSQQPRQQQQHQLPNVIVVGAGLAGLATSLGLANSGKYQVDLVERQSNFGRKGATFGLAPNGVKALEEIDPGSEGVMASLHQLGIDMSQTQEGLQGYMLGWWMVRDALLERVQSRSDKIRIHLGYTVKDIIDDPGTPVVQATFQPATNDYEAGDASSSSSENLTLEGCLIVGSDGVYSSIRDYLKCPPAQSVGATIWRGSVALYDAVTESIDSETRQLLVPLLGKGIVAMKRIVSPTIINVFNFNSKVSGRLAWAVVSKVPDIPPRANAWDAVLESYLKDDDDRKVMKALLHLSNPDDVCFPTALSVTPLPTQDGNGWGGKGRITLIGDAAHALRPVTGLGGSMAFEDVAVLCRALKQFPETCTTKFEDVSQLVLQVENERLPRVRRIWTTEQLVAEQDYRKDPAFVNPVTAEYANWLYQGV